uniref:Uncharacterized protein n=1 Tax=Cacopsylla melanoneura TaxID=428564 RepID=A0A8D8LJQ2_9HEMI
MTIIPTLADVPCSGYNVTRIAILRSNIGEDVETVSHAGPSSKGYARPSLRQVKCLCRPVCRMVAMRVSSVMTQRVTVGASRPRGLLYLTQASDMADPSVRREVK